MKTNEDFMSDLIDKATTEKHRQFLFLRTWQEYREAKKIQRAHKLLVSSLKQSLDKLFKKYCKSVDTGETEIIKLLAYNTIKRVLAFYEEELRILTEMIYEYEAYLLTDDNFARAWLLGIPRSIDELRDYRD